MFACFNESVGSRRRINDAVCLFPRLVPANEQLRRVSKRGGLPRLGGERLLSHWSKNLG